MNLLIETIYGALAFTSFFISIALFISASDFRGTKLSDKEANIQITLGILLFVFFLSFLYYYFKWNKVKKILLNFKEIDFKSFNNTKFDFNSTEEIEIDFEYYNNKKHRLIFDNLLKFKNLKIIRIISSEDLIIDSFDLSPLINFKSLEKVYLLGDSLRPFGLIDKENNNINFEIIIDGLPSIQRIMHLDQEKVLRLFGAEINFFDTIDFDKLFVDYFNTSQARYEGLSLEEIESFEEIILDSFTPVDQIKNGKLIDLSNLAICKNIKNFRITKEYPIFDDEELCNKYFDLDTIPNFNQLKLIEIHGFVDNYDFIEKFSKIEEIIIDLNHYGKVFLSNDFNKIFTSVKKISIKYSDPKLITNLSKLNHIFPNLEELTLEGYRDILKINPLEIITHKNLKILNFKDSQFFDFNSKTISKIDIDEESYNKSIDWCEKRISK